MKSKTFLMILGTVAVILSFVVPIFFTFFSVKEPTMGVIGGADTPTFAMLYWQLKMYILTAVGAILLLVPLVKRR